MCWFFRGQTSSWPNHRGPGGFSRGAQRASVPLSGTKAVSDFQTWLLSIWARVQLLLFYFVIGLIAIVDSSLCNVLFIFTKTQYPVVVLLNKRQILGVWQMHENLLSPWRGKFSVEFAFRDVYGWSPASSGPSVRRNDVTDPRKTWEIQTSEVRKSFDSGHVYQGYCAL